MYIKYGEIIEYAYNILKTATTAWALGFLITDLLELKSVMRYGHKKYWDKKPPVGITRKKMIELGLNEKAKGFSLFSVKFTISGCFVFGSCAFYEDVASRIILALIGCALIFYGFVISSTPSIIENSERNRID